MRFLGSSTLAALLASLSHMHPNLMNTEIEIEIKLNNFRPQGLSFSGFLIDDLFLPQ